MFQSDHPAITAMYIIASVLFIAGLKMLNHATSARRGNMVSGVGMLIAIIATCLLAGMEFHWIIVGCLIGTLIGAVASYSVKMTAMPEMVGLFNGFGGLASMLVAWAEYHKWHTMGWGGPGDPHGYYATLGAGAPDSTLFTAFAIAFTALVGAMTFSGSLVAYLKLAEKITGKPILFKGQQIVNSLIIAVALGALAFLSLQPQGDLAYTTFAVIMVVGLILGVTSVIPIGGADMPVVISL